MNGNKLTLIFLILISFASCISKSGNMCEWEIQNYIESWNFEVLKTYKHPDYKATFVIESVDGKQIFFRPIQSIVTLSKKGDRIKKEAYSEYALRISPNGDELISRIYSISCDSIVNNAVNQPPGQRDGCSNR